MIIDNSYFLNKSVYIPNAVANPSIQGNTPNPSTQLSLMIDLREYELLVSFLGDAQATELQNQFELLPNATVWTWKASALPKWKDLVDGVGDWKGLRYTYGSTKISLIAYYVYFHYLGDDFSQYTTTGVQVPQAENSIRQQPNNLQVKAWNKFVEMYGNQRFGKNYSFSNVWNGLAMQWGVNTNGNQKTLYEFMTENAETYDTSFFIPKSVVNIYNL